MIEKHKIYTDFENTMLSVFDDFYFNDECWVLQKRIKWNKRGIPVKDLSLFDFEYKIRKQKEINEGELFLYYTIDFIEIGNDCKMRIDCSNNNVGVGQKYGFQHFIELSFYHNQFRFQEKNSIKEFFHFLLSNFKPSIFSFT